MDALRLLSRGAKTKKNVRDSVSTTAPPSAQESKPQLFASSTSSRKRKRGESTAPSSATESSNNISFFRLDDDGVQKSDHSSDSDDHHTVSTAASKSNRATRRSLPERKALLKQHKIKVNLLGKQKVRQQGKTTTKAHKHDKVSVFPNPVLNFADLTEHGLIPTWLRHNLVDCGFTETTEVQMAALDLQLANSTGDSTDESEELLDLIDSDLLTVAPTGSGKTLAFLIPSLIRISRQRSQQKEKSRITRTIILAPTKELVDQIVNDGRRLSRKSGITIAHFRKGLLLRNASKSDAGHESSSGEPDILVSTPGVLHNTLQNADEDDRLLHTVRHLILDEADVLLDPLFREQTLGVWQRLTNKDLNVSLWSATMGSNIEELTQWIIAQRLDALLAKTGKDIQQRPLIRLVVGLKDSAVPNVEHKLIYAATEQGKLMGLRQLLHPATASVDSAPALRPPFMIFTQTIERARALHSELLYDIPAEAGGISRIAVLHSTLSDTARESVMTRFRNGEVWVLITTDLLSRGIDFRGVNGVVNYDIPSSSAAYVHRVGRTGRAGREGGVAVTLYSKEDIPYLKHIANVVVAAQREKGLDDDASGVQKWLLDALPTLSKNEKQRLKKHGVEVRTARAMTKDPKAARRARISTKAGYDRRTENRKRNAIEASKRRTTDDAVATTSRPEGDDFDGFA